MAGSGLWYRSDVDMPMRSRYITEEFLEERLDERFAEQAELIQRGFADADGRFSRLEAVVQTLARQVETGFNKLDEFTRDLRRLDEAEVMNQAAHRRFDDRLTALEPRSTA